MRQGLALRDVGHRWRWALRLLTLWLAAGCSGTQAQELRLSGFGTLGYAVSDQAHPYQKFIDRRGGFERDSLFALQWDAVWTPQWGATAQIKLAPDPSSENAWRAQLAWAFLSWRPADDWLVRLGKLRVPAYLHSQSLDVGVTFDHARLPVELYGNSPTYDFEGASFVKTWTLPTRELTLEGYWGRADPEIRDFFRTGVPGLIPAGALYTPVDLDARGLVLSLQDGDASLYRLGWHQVDSRTATGEPWAVAPAWVELAPGWRYGSVFPGSGAPTRDTIRFSFLNLGVAFDLGHDIRLTGEFGRRWASGVISGLNSRSAYVSVSKSWSGWTPYVYLARLKSDSASLDAYLALDSHPIADEVPQAELLRAVQRASADFLLAFDQQTWGLGLSYALTPSSKFKLEWAQTRVGAASSLVDSLQDQRFRHQRLQVLSMSYNFAF